MGKQYRNIVRSRKLAERSYLYFKYPFKNKSLEFYLPFMENIEISESQKPNYATYDLIGRAGSLFAYLGSKSREMQLTFNITLPNVIDYIHTVGLSEMFSDNFREILLGDGLSSKEREKFFRGEERTNYNGPNSDDLGKKFDYYTQGKLDIQYIDSSYIDGDDKKGGTRGLFNDIAQFFNKPWGFGESIGGPEIKKSFPDINTQQAVDYLMMWVNVIRTSVINNAENTQYGPPTVYLNHGTMYNNIPCVCTGYSVKIVNNAGYELLSLAPRQVQITMQLSETRVGNFEKFEPFKLVEGDNLAGWEAIIQNHGTMDPNNQFLRYWRADNQELKRIEDAARDQALAQSWYNEEAALRKAAEPNYNL